jgi:hypothetical protein
MKKSPLILLALLSLVPLAPSMAQAPAVAAAPATAATAPVYGAATSQFLATLSGQSQTPKDQTPRDLAPAPSFMTGCTSNDQCAAGQICCNACGTVPEGGTCPRACFTGRKCPLFE